VPDCSLQLRMLIVMNTLKNRDVDSPTTIDVSTLKTMTSLKHALYQMLDQGFPGPTFVHPI
jgi:hypothetical protein